MTSRVVCEVEHSVVVHTILLSMCAHPCSPHLEMSVGGKCAVEVQLYLLLPLALWEGEEREEEGREGGRGENRGREGWERKERRANVDRLFVAGNHHETNTHIGF